MVMRLYQGSGIFLIVIEHHYFFLKISVLGNGNSIRSKILVVNSVSLFYVVCCISALLD